LKGEVAFPFLFKQLNKFMKTIKEGLTYNTQRSYMHIPEYGRNVQKMINYAKKIENREERNRAAQAIIDVMGQLNPHLRDVDDYKHKLWTHLFMMSNFELDVDSPYPKPELEVLQAKPKIMSYPENAPKYGHFGYYAEEMIRQIAQIESEEEKEYMTSLLGNLMKKNYLNFHTDNVENKIIEQHLRELSKGKLQLKNSEEELMSTNQILRQFGVTPTKVKKTSKPRKRKK
jgi:hypothetical protein